MSPLSAFQLSAFSFFLLLLGVPSGVKAAAPDLTTVDLSTINTTVNYNLGPTGMRGWIYAASPGGYLASQGTTTSWQPWQILVTTVGAGTPASGIMASNDVILGVSAGAASLPVPLFTSDARKSMGWAIGAAEAGDGKLNLKRWRGGVTTDVTLQLQVLGAYSATAPYNCPKSAVILSNASVVIGSRSFNAGTPGDPVLGLALLASGNANNLAKAQSYAYSIAPATLALRFAPGQDTSGSGLWVWGYGYKLVFLAEYYLRTGDTNVLHGINEYAVSLAQAQSRYGTMAHGGANLNADGSFHGTVGGYGPVNSGGLVANLGIVLAKKCLVAAGMAVDPEIDPAIGRAAKFFGWYVQKGNIPYGEHEPWYYHAGNGKEYLTALMFAMMGDQPVATEYWARMSLAGYNGQQYGHTGQGFSYVWSGMGVNVGGTNAMAAYMAQTQWYMDLERRWDGSFVYDGQEQFGGSQNVTDYGTVGGNNDYYGIDPTASWVLTYALPKQQLYLTGRNANPANWLSSDKVTNAIWAGVYDQLVAGYNTNQLMSALGEYDPLVRSWAATQLGKLSTAAPLFPVLTNLVGSSTNPWVRSAACTALGAMGNTNAVRVLVQALRDPDNWVRDLAAKALWPFSAATVSPLLTNIMMAFTNNATDPNNVAWSDPVQIANGALANEIFGYGVNNPTPNNLGSLLASTPTNLYYATVRTGLRIPDSATRQCGANYAKNLLPLAGVKAVLPDLMACAAEMTQADTMWCGGCRAAAIQALGKYYVAEALPLALSMLNVPPGDGSGSFGWNSDSWQVPAMNVLGTYGDAARWTLPSLNDYLNTGWGYGVNSGTFAAVQSAMASIRSAVTTPTAMTNLYPVANAQVVVTTNAKPITLTGFSWRTNTVAFTNVTAPAHGTLTGTAPNLTYTPANGYTGMDRFTFQVRDSFTNSDPATVSLIVGTPPGTGLKVEYYDNANFTNLKFTRTDPQVNFDWGTGSPSNSITADTFSVRWSGLLLAPETRNYRFSTLNSDGVRLYVNGVQVIDDWMDQVRQWTDGAPIALVAGQQYPVQMDFYEAAGDAVAKLKWTGPSFAGTNGALIGQQWLYNGASVTTWPAIAYPQTVTMLQNTNCAITLEGAGNPTYAIVTSPAHGTLTGTPPTVTYTPATNYNGTDSFTFLVNNGISNSAPATVSINVWAGLPVSYTWKSAASGYWSVAGNWTSGAPGAAGQPNYTLNFTPSGTYTVSNDLNNGFVLNQLNVAGTVTFAGSNSPAFTANGPILPQINQNSANTVTFTVPLTLAAMTALGGTGGGAVTMPAPISGAGGLIKNASGTLNLNYGTNTYSGGTTINAGTVAFPAYSANTTALLGTGPVTVNSGATLALNRTALANSVTLNNATVTAGNSFGSTLSGPVTLSGISTISVSGNLTIAGNISGAGGLTKTLGSTVPVTGINTYSGPTTISAGALKFKSSLYVNDTAKWIPANITVASGAALVLNVGGAGEFTIAQAGALFAQLATGVNNNGLRAGSKIGVDTSGAGAAAVTTYSAILADSSGPGGGAVGIKHFGVGTLELTGANTYSGVSMTDNDGTLKVSSLNSVNGGSPPLATSSLGRPTTIANGTIWLGTQTTFRGGKLTYTGTGETTDRVLNLGGANNTTYTLDQSGSGLLKFTSAFTITDNRGPKTIVLQGSTAGRGEIASVIPNGDSANPNRLTKSGTGTWTLDGVNDYTGVTLVSGGVLACASAAALGSGPLTINGGKLELDFFGTRQVASLTLGSTVQANGTYGSSSSIATTKNDTYFAGTGTVTVGPLPPAPGSFTNRPASGITTASATLNATLGCAGVIYDVVACWNTVNGGTNPTTWTNSAAVGSWANVVSTNLSLPVSGLTPNTTYYFAFRATNALDTLWATNVQSFTTLTPTPPTPVLLGSAITVSGGVPTLTFATVTGYKYRLACKNALSDTSWVAVIAPPGFPLPDGWSATSTGLPMSLSDTNTAGQPQRFYRLEAH